MNPNSMNSPAWIVFCYVSFGVALATMLLGVWLTPIDLALKGFFSMGVLFLTGSCFTLAKTLRDEHEARRFHNRLDEAKTERLLREIDREGDAEAA